MCRAFLGSILILPLAIALFFGSAAFPDCHWCQLWSPSTVTSILSNRIRNARTQKNYSLNVTNCPGLFLPLSAIFLSDINRMFSPSFFSQAMCSIRSSRIGVDLQRNLILLGALVMHLETIFSILPFGSLMKLHLGACPRLFLYSYFSVSIRTVTDDLRCVTPCLSTGCTSTFSMRLLGNLSCPRSTSTLQKRQSRAPRSVRTYSSTTKHRHSPFGSLADPIPIRCPFLTHV